MSMTSPAGLEATVARSMLRRVVAAVVLALVVIGTGLPAARAAERTPVPRPEPCLNLLTCGPGTLPPGTVDPGPKPRHPALSAPEVVFTAREAFSTGAGRFVRHDLDVENWQSYDPQLFDEASHLPAELEAVTDPRICGRRSTVSRTWVGIHDADSGRQIYGHCAIGKPEGLRTVHFPIRSGTSAAAAIYLTMTDRETRRTVRSNPVEIPQQVTVRYTGAESANINFAARHWGTPRHSVQQNGVMAIRFIHGVAGTTGSDPLRPRPEVSGPVSYRSRWTTEDRRALDWVSDYYDLTYAETHKLGTAVMVFFAALDQ